MKSVENDAQWGASLTASLSSEKKTFPTSKPNKEILVVDICKRISPFPFLFACFIASALVCVV